MFPLIGQIGLISLILEKFRQLYPINIFDYLRDCFLVCLLNKVACVSMLGLFGVLQTSFLK